MKSLMFVFVFTELTCSAFSQTVQQYTGAKIDEAEYGTFSFLQTDSTKLYALRYKDQTYFLDVYEKQNLKRSKLIKIPLPSRDSAKFSLENLFIQNDRFQIFYSYFDKSSSAEKLEMISFDADGNKTGETKLIDQSEGKNQKEQEIFRLSTEKHLTSFCRTDIKAQEIHFISILTILIIRETKPILRTLLPTLMIM